MDSLSAARQPIRVLIAGDHPAVREGLRAYLNSGPDVKVVGIAEDGKEALKMAKSTKPDVVLMDLRLPRCEGVKAMERLEALLQGSRVVWFSFEDDEDSVIRMKEAGASGFVSKQGPAAEVMKAILEVGAGRPYFRPEILGKAPREPASPRPRRRKPLKR